ncbi:putative ABC transporter permease [Candidatus Saccharibacteria bacterium]|nr:putative ABC transporter permease [Candidatus Saccharibacteria bacterium]
MVKSKKSQKVKLQTYQKVGILMLVFVIAGVVGWIYEFVVAWIENGHIMAKGGNLLPWINIYAFGALLILPTTYRFRKKPIVVFLVAALVTGLLELLGGWLVYTIGNGTRYWNYDDGLWAFGSINGFVCPLSVTIFGIGALILVYFVMPFCITLATKMSKRAFLTLAISLFVLILADELTNLTLKNLGQPTAMDLYRSLGLEYEVH